MRRGSLSYRFLDRYLGIPVLRAASLLNRRRAKPPVFSVIGILASPTLGDTLLTSAAVLDVRNAFPNARLVYFASPGARAAVHLIPHIDQVIDIDIVNPVHTLRAIRRCRLDLIIDFSQWQRVTAFYSGFSGARYRVGFHSKDQFRHWLYDCAAYHSDERHEVDNFRALIQAVGVTPGSPLSLTLPSGPKQPASSSYIVFHPWASGKRACLREWSLENWVELARRISTPHTSFFITGSPWDLTRSRQLAAELQNADLSAEPFCGRDGLAGVSRLLKTADLVVSVNTGIMHLAAILGAPTIGLNGPTATHRWGPYGPQACSVEPRGGGGFLHFGFEFDGNPTDTMQRIHIDDVVDTAQTLLSRQQQAAVSA